MATGDATADGPVVPKPPGLGGELTPTGATFRVWAPDADAVAVTGDFDAWTMTAHPLTKEAGSIWAGSVAGARAGQRYRYVVMRGGQTLTRSDPRARRLEDADGNTVLVDPAAYAWTQPSFTAAAVSEQVIYELHVGTFNVRSGEGHGTYASAIDRLDALAALGITMVELLPIAEFPGDRSWGYNPAGPFAVESSYGTPDELKALVDAAHARGIGVIIDVVHNHYEADPLLRCWDGDCTGANGIYFYTGALASTPWGPRPDFGRSEVRDYIQDNALMWLGEYRCDGLRWDSTVNIAQGIMDGWTMLRSINDAVDAQFPTAIQIAEDWRNDSFISRPTAMGGAGFDSQWDGFVHDINSTILAGSDGARAMGTVQSAISRVFNGHASERVIFTESHDEVANGRSRIPEMISPGNAGSLIARQLSTLGAAVTLTSPGIPMLFMGQEMLTDGHFDDNRPLDWSRATTYSGIVKLYTDLVHLRRNTDGTTAGLTGDGTSVFHVNDAAKVIAWRRWKLGGDDVVVIANFSSQRFATYEIGLPSSGTWRVRFRSDSAAYSPDFDNPPTSDVVATPTARDGLPYTGAMALGRYELVVLSR
jgi:1,4-alpha-glucan branching enzyme